jgi:hypothetical protein
MDKILERLILKFSLRKVTIILSFSFLFLLFLSWHLAIKKTYSLYQNYKSLKDNNLSEEGIYIDLNHLKKEKLLLDSHVNRYTVDSLIWSDRFFPNIIQYIDRYELELSYSRDVHKLPNPDSIIRKSISVTGKYPNIIKFLDTLKSQPQLGFISEIDLKAADEKSGDKIIADIMFTVIKE